MLKLSRAWSGVTTKATPLPDVWKNLVKQSIKFRRGQVCMVAAAPNAGKSMFALIYAIKANVPTLFFSADTDTATVMIRAAAHPIGPQSGYCGTQHREATKLLRTTLG